MDGLDRDALGNGGILLLLVMELLSSPSGSLKR